MGAVVGFRGFLIQAGGVFLGLILFLMYLGGMLVVFAYSAALASDRYPDVGWRKAVPLVLLGGSFIPFYTVSGGEELLENGGVVGELNLEGVSSLYGPSWVGLVIGGLGLFVCLLVVLYLVRGLATGALRAV